MTEPDEPTRRSRLNEQAAQEYMDAHPEVDWTTHEVLYSYRGDLENMTVESHWPTPDYEALKAAMDEMDAREAVWLRSQDVTQCVIRTDWFRDLYAAYQKLMVLEAAGVDAWEGYAPAMTEWEEEMVVQARIAHMGSGDNDIAGAPGAEGGDGGPEVEPGPGPSAA